MKTILISESFLSIEGEGPHTGIPTFYIRTVGCNFKCSGFNNPDKKVIKYNKIGHDPVLGFNPEDYLSLDKLPPINIGCDTLYSTSDTRFKHLWKKTSWEEILNSCPDHVKTLSLTGGEPSLWQDCIAEFLNSPLSGRFSRIIFETNASKAYSVEFLLAIEKWAKRHGDWVWSNSPKLSCSGHTREEAIKPDVLLQQQELCSRFPLITQYLKFVSDGTTETEDEINQVLMTYRLLDVKVWGEKINIMPMACTNEQQSTISRRVADYCIKMGFRYCHRVQLEVYGNTVGT